MINLLFIGIGFGLLVVLYMLIFIVYNEIKLKFRKAVKDIIFEDFRFKKLKDKKDNTELINHIHYYLLMFTDYEDINYNYQLYPTLDGYRTITYKNVFENSSKKSLEEIKENPVNISEFIKGEK